MLKLRELTEEDVTLVEAWLYMPHVKKWFEVPNVCTIDDWMSEIKGRHDKYKWLKHLIVMQDSEPIGFCVYYKCADSNEDFGDLLRDGTYGIGYFIGDPSLTGKGVGKRIIRLLVAKIFSLPDALRITADPANNNKASQKVLLANRFTLYDKERSLYVLEKKKGSD